MEGFLEGFNTFDNLLDETIDIEKNRDPYWLPPLVITILNTSSENNITKVAQYKSLELSKRIDGFYFEPDNYEYRLKYNF